MALETLLGLFLVRFQGSFKDDFEIVRVSRWSHVEGTAVTSWMG